jgi:uncharacterized membrane protein
MYKGVLKIFRRYWAAYGGSRALLRSPYLHLALLLLVVTAHTWIEPQWWEDVMSVLPNLLGFTLGGFAIFIGFGDEKFRALLAMPEEDPAQPTVYVSLCATFVHFILIQVLALIYAVVAKSWWFCFPWPDLLKKVLPYLNMVGGAVGYGLFLYALTSVLAATMHVFRIASMYEQHQQSQNTDAS